MVGLHKEPNAGNTLSCVEFLSFFRRWRRCGEESTVYNLEFFEMERYFPKAVKRRADQLQMYHFGMGNQSHVSPPLLAKLIGMRSILLCSRPFSLQINGTTSNLRHVFKYCFAQKGIQRDVWQFPYVSPLFIISRLVNHATQTKSAKFLDKKTTLSPSHSQFLLPLCSSREIFSLRILNNTTTGIMMMIMMIIIIIIQIK